jgi:hypothetical protein
MITLLWLLFVSQSEPVASEHYIDPCIQSGIKKTIVFLGEIQPAETAASAEPIFFGTAFLTQIDGINYLMTAKHVIEGFAKTHSPDADILAFMNNAAGGRIARSINVNKREYSVDWITVPNRDIAIMPFGLPPEADALTIPQTFFRETSRLSELLDVFFVSYQPGVTSRRKILPVFRRGMISAFNDDGTFYLDGFAFPGNSGSPVFIKPSGIVLGVAPEQCRFIGIIGEYVAYTEAAISPQTLRVRIVFEENTGLARVWPIEALNELISSMPFEAQHTRVKKIASPK